MDIREVTLWGLERTRGGLLRSVDSLTPEQVAWRPCQTCNSIGSMVIHLGRVQDTWTHRIMGGQELWEIEGWAQRFGLPVEDRGWSYDKQSLQEKQPLAELLAYYEATHRLLTKTIQELPEDRFTETPEHPLNFTIEQVFGHLVIEENQHVGQIDYLKGQQQSLGS